MKKNNDIFYLILLLGLGLRLYFAFSGHYISSDGTQYARLGHHLWHEFQYVSQGSQFPDIVQPPLYPATLGFFTLFVSPEYAGKLASIIFGLLLIAAVFRFTRWLSGNEQAANAAALFVALNPGLVAVSSQVASESLFFFLLFAAFAAVLRYLRRPSFKTVLWAGLLFGLAVWTRPEALLYFAVSALILLIERVRWRHWLGFVAVSLVFWGAYFAWSSTQLDRFTLYPKLDFVRAQGALARHFAASDRGGGHRMSHLAREDRFRYSLTPDGRELAADALFLKGDRRILGAQGTSRIPAKTKLRRAAEHYVQNARLAAGKFLHGKAFPLLYWIFLLAGLWGLSLRKYRREVRAGVLFLLPLALIVFSNTEQRFFYIVPILAAPLLGRGLLQTARFLNAHKNRRGSWIVLLLLLFLGMLPGYGDIAGKTQRKDYYFQAGKWLRAHVPPGERVAATVPQAVFFAGRNYCVLPFAPLDSLRNYVRGKDVDFILLEDGDSLRRPNVNQNALPSFVEKKETAIINKHRFILLRVKKE
jgi:4-amino-4-deoxy-L-arabinose transferase-like glycosyltransferase